MQGATVSLTGAAGEKQRTELTDENGFFTIAADAGAFALEIGASGFAIEAVHGELEGSQQLDLGRIALKIAMTTTEVRVSLTGEELAEQQVRAEKRSSGYWE